MQVLATRLTDEVSITLVEDRDGWRFASWSRSAILGGGAIPPPPTDAVARRFATSGEALTYFEALALCRVPNAVADAHELAS